MIDAKRALAIALATTSISCGGGALPPSPGRTVDLTQALSDAGTQGTGACKSSSLGQVIALVQANNSQLADIDTLAGPAWMDRAGLIFAFSVPEGFRIVFKRGWGDDCAAGCTSNEYWYFETDSQCRPQQVGHYSSVLDQPRGCFVVTDDPLWGFPVPRSPACPSQ